MRLSLGMFGSDPESCVPIARKAEALGFEAVFLGDHVALPTAIGSRYPYGTGRVGFAYDSPIGDPWVTFGCLAGVTTRIKLGTAVYILPMRSPFATAHAVATAQNLANGRLIFGVGSGWCREEFDALGEQFSRRGARMDEILDILEKLWSGRPVEHHGAWYSFPEVRLGVAPRVRVPLLFGGHTLRALQRTALRGDGWIGGPQPLDELVSVRATLSDLRARAGRSETPFTYYVRLVGPATADKLRAFEDAGFDHVMVRLRDYPEPLPAIEEVANVAVSAGYRLD